MAPANDPLEDSGQDGDGHEHHHVLRAGRVVAVAHHHQVAQHGDGDDDGEVDAPGDDEDARSYGAQDRQYDPGLHGQHHWHASPGQVVDAEDGD